MEYTTLENKWKEKYEILVSLLKLECNQISPQSEEYSVFIFENEDKLIAIAERSIRAMQHLHDEILKERNIFNKRNGMKELTYLSTFLPPRMIELESKKMSVINYETIKKNQNIFDEMDPRDKKLLIECDQFKALNFLRSANETKIAFSGKRLNVGNGLIVFSREKDLKVSVKKADVKTRYFDKKLSFRENGKEYCFKVKDTPEDRENLKSFEDHLELLTLI